MCAISTHLCLRMSAKFKENPAVPQNPHELSCSGRIYAVRVIRA